MKEHFTRYVTIAKFCEMSGYSIAAVKSKRRDGVWLESNVWVKAPDGRILIDLIGYEAWVVSDSVRQIHKPGYRSAKSPTPPGPASGGISRSPKPPV